jgi:hypothetical protein
MPVTSTDFTNYIKKHIVAIIIIWIFVLILIKIITCRTSHDELFKWYNNQDNTQKSYSCISAWEISTAIELPSILRISSKPFQNSATPYFLDGLAKRFGDINSMPPGSTMMTIDDWCVGLGLRLSNWASSVTNNFTDPVNTKINVTVNLDTSTSVSIFSWTIANLALSVDGGVTVLDSYNVYQQYGSPIAWQYPQWKGWLSCRVRPPAFPSWSDEIAFNQIANNYTTPSSFDPTKQTPNGTFIWGSPFVQTGYLAPSGCLASGCSDKGNCPTNTCGFVPKVEGDPPCTVGGKCMISAYENHQKLPWTEPELPSLGDIGCGQYAANNPFIAFNIPASSPIILKFLGYGFDAPDITQTTTGGQTVITYSGGPASDQYTQVSQFLDIVNGGFVKYSENFGKSQESLENYLFGEYTYEAKGANLTPKPQKTSSPPCGKGKLAGNVISGAMGGAGIGMMAAPAAGPAAPFVAVAAIGFGAFGGYLSTDSKCGGGSDLCAIM